jgi:Tfp pilus assembly protein PilF
MNQKTKSKPTMSRDIAIIVVVIAVGAAAYAIFDEKPQQLPPDPHAGITMPPAVDAAMMDNLPSDFASLVSMGNQVMDAGNHAFAAECYRRALEIDGSSPEVRTDLGACLHALGTPDKAAEQFRLVLTDHPNHLIANFNMGIVQWDMDQLDSARTYFEKTIALDPQGQMAQAAENMIQRLND